MSEKGSNKYDNWSIRWRYVCPGSDKYNKRRKSNRNSMKSKPEENQNTYNQFTSITYSHPSQEVDINKIIEQEFVSKCKFKTPQFHDQESVKYPFLIIVILLICILRICQELHTSIVSNGVSSSSSATKTSLVNVKTNWTTYRLPDFNIFSPLRPLSRLIKVLVTSFHPLYVIPFQETNSNSLSMRPVEAQKQRIDTRTRNIFIQNDEIE